MAIFASKKNTEKKVTKKAASAVSTVPAETSAPSAAQAHHFDAAALVLGPRVTEKATTTSEKGVYVFNVHPTATKVLIAKALKDIYNVVPRKIAIARVPEKQVFSRGKFGTKKGGKKAYVYLRAGDKIEIM